VSANLVIEATKYTKETPKPDPEKLERLVEARASMLPAEAAARSDLESRIVELERRGRAEQKGRRLGLSILSPEIFQWKKNNLPAFAVFDITGDGECVISTDPAQEKIPTSVKAFYQQVLPQALTNRVQAFFTKHFKAIWCISALIVEACYFYTAQASTSVTWGRFVLGLILGILASFCASLMCLIVLIAGWTLFARESQTTAFARFDGLIPQPVKQKIKFFQSEFKEILIVAEANWTLSQEKQALRVPAVCDPLVVGWDGDYFWLIDRFDTSTVERLASDEFAVRPEHLDSGLEASLSPRAPRFSSN
jgi:hypothetical protein